LGVVVKGNFSSRSASTTNGSHSDIQVRVTKKCLQYMA
jgi:hypothetical protein